MPKVDRLKLYGSMKNLSSTSTPRLRYWLYDHSSTDPHTPKYTPLLGREMVAGTDAMVVDFWCFALSNLQMHNARGQLAEFLVAKAVGSTGQKIEWDPYNVLAPDGATIEIKTSAYLQARDLHELSRIQFTGLRNRIWITEGEPTLTLDYSITSRSRRYASTRHKLCKTWVKAAGASYADVCPQGPNPGIDLWAAPYCQT